jgi:hypothetical protein
MDKEKILDDMVHRLQMGGEIDFLECVSKYGSFEPGVFNNLRESAEREALIRSGVVKPQLQISEDSFNALTDAQKMSFALGSGRIVPADAEPEKPVGTVTSLAGTEISAEEYEQLDSSEKGSFMLDS